MNRRDFLKRTLVGAFGCALGITATPPDPHSIDNTATQEFDEQDFHKQFWDDFTQLRKIVPQEQEPARLPVLDSTEHQRMKWYAYQDYGFAVLDNHKVLLADFT